MIRNRIKNDPGFKKEVSEYEMAGKFVPDHIVSEMVLHEVHGIIRELDYDNNLMVLDGFPRTESQISVISSSLFLGWDKKVLFRDTPYETCRERALAGRRGRSDDTAKSFDRKVKDFEEVTKPIIHRLMFVHGGLVVSGPKIDYKDVNQVVKELDLHNYFCQNTLTKEFDLWREHTQSDTLDCGTPVPC